MTPQRGGVRTAGTALAFSLVLGIVCTACAGPAAEPEATDSGSAPAVSAGPSASASPNPSASAADELVLTAAGLAELVIGEPVPADTDLVEWGDVCGLGVSRWHALGATAADPGAFSVRTEDWAHDGAVQAIWVWTDDIATAEGITIGSSRDEVLAAYPQAQSQGEDVATGATDVLVVPGDATNLVIEILRDGSSISADSEVASDTVAWLYAQSSDLTLRTLDGTASPASCA
ncbi:MAG: hypothetical protein QM635_00065 [Microbacteriaceae bacterium]